MCEGTKALRRHGYGREFVVRIAERPEDIASQPVR